LKFQLSYFLKESYSCTLTEVTNSKSDEGLSAVDKIAMNTTKIDEGIVIMADINVDMTTKRLFKQFDIEVSNEELKYYCDNFTPSKLQMDLVQAYLAKYFKSYIDLTLLSMNDYIRLLLIIKKKLLMELGFEDEKKGELYYAVLPYLLTGNLSEKVSTRIIRNTKFVEKIEASSKYQKLVTGEYRYLEEIKPGYIMSILSQAINTRYTYCVYEYPEILGEEIVYPEDKICDELLFYLGSI
jgi:hypothetical protein